VVAVGSFSLTSATLRVHDLAASSDFYRRLGLRVVANADRATVHGGGAPLLTLLEAPSAPKAASRGAYHVAIAVPERRALAEILRTIARERLPVDGFADHHVSEALYLPDAEGIGLEFCADRPSDTWWVDGELVIGTEPLDLPGLLAEPPLASPEAAFASARIGHVHLYTPDVAADVRFYASLGLEVVTRGPWGTFVAADRYHHHVGLRPGRPLDAATHHGLVRVDARIAPERYAALAAPEGEDGKALVAPSGLEWRVRPLI
jgi:catechol 2,3-dioxygenase